MFYLGMDRARRQRLGVAMSGDGVSWYKLRSNPILELGDYGAFDENGLGEPAVWAARGYYWMLYTGRDRNEVRRLGLARSRDGVRWEKLPMVIARRTALGFESDLRPDRNRRTAIALQYGSAAATWRARIRTFTGKLASGR